MIPLSPARQAFLTKRELGVRIMAARTRLTVDGVDTPSASVADPAI
jgi:hypothetical protein